MGVVALLLLVLAAEGTLAVKELLRKNPEEDIFPLLGLDDLDVWANGFDLSLAERAIQLLDPLDEVVQIHLVLAGLDSLSISPVSSYTGTTNGL